VAERVAAIVRKPKPEANEGPVRRGGGFAAFDRTATEIASRSPAVPMVEGRLKGKGFNLWAFLFGRRPKP
jgi:hypothetical protein